MCHLGKFIPSPLSQKVQETCDKDQYQEEKEINGRYRGMKKKSMAMILKSNDKFTLFLYSIALFFASSPLSGFGLTLSLSLFLFLLSIIVRVSFHSLTHSQRQLFFARIRLYSGAIKVVS